MMTATYSPDDNKLRLYSSARLDAETYARVKAAGFRWAPKQDLFVCPAWSPAAEDLLLDLCGEIGDEDTSLTDRAEQRAERFEEYSEKRADDAERAREGVAAIADGIPLGQPILVGHHSERHARKDAERIENGMRRAVKMWETSQYWTRRAAGALRHAKYKELPGVRHRRIKGLEADRRKQERAKADAEGAIRAWRAITEKAGQFKYKDGRPTTLHERARLVANVANYWSQCFPLADYPRDPPASQYEGAMSLWSALGDTPEEAIISPEQAQAIAITASERIILHASRWAAHLDNRLAYERAMLGESGGIAADAFDVQVGGRVLVRGEWLVVTKVNRKDGAVVSVSTAGGYVRVRGIEEIKDYRAPQPGDAEKVKAATALAPLCNYPGPGFLSMTKAEYEKTVPRWSDFPKIGVVAATETTGKHRVRQTRGKTAWSAERVFLTDVKRVDPPALGAPPPKLTPERDERATREQAERLEARNVKREQRDVEAAPFDALRESLRAGVQVVSAPQLFPTPRDLAERVVALAGIQPGDRILEPSAGTGALVDALDAFPRVAAVVAVEINATLADRVRLRSASRTDVRCADFLECNGDLGTFDRIVMNPPFAHAEDIKHVRHALTLLKPGGRLVAICANGPRQQEQLKPLADEWIDLSADTFKEAGTSVHAALLVITKEA